MKQIVLNLKSDDSEFSLGDNYIFLVDNQQTGSKVWYSNEGSDLKMQEVKQDLTDIRAESNNIIPVHDTDADNRIIGIGNISIDIMQPNVATGGTTIDYKFEGYKLKRINVAETIAQIQTLIDGGSVSV